MLSEEALGRLAEPLFSRINKVNSDFLKIIGKRIKEAGELLPSDVNRLQKMYEYGADMEAVVRELEKAAELDEKDIYKIFDKAGKDGYSYAKPFYKAAGLKFIPYEENEAIKKYVASLARQTAGACKDFTAHSVFKVFGKTGAKEATSLSETYTRVIDEAVQAVTMGVDDYQSAMRRTVRALAQSGIKTADYASGYSRRLDTAVRQNLLYGLKECYNGIFEMTGKEFGADGYEIDYHSNPRPSHAEMSGRQYAIGHGRVVNGEYYPSIDEVQHLLDEYNCYHRKMPIILGISEPAYSAKELEGYKARDKEKIEYEGKEWTRYEGTQLQRKIETAIRHEKDKAIIAKAAGDETLQLESQYRINALAYRYKEISDKFGLPTKAERLRVDGFKTKNIDNPVKSGIIKSGAVSGARNPNGQKAKKHAEKYYGLVRSMKNDVSKIANVTEFSEDEIWTVKKFIFYDKHDLGGEMPERFEPDYMMSESWRRLIAGKPLPHDITMIKHEILEKNLMDNGYSQHDAHILASKKYNYAKEADEFYGKIKKYKD